MIVCPNCSHSNPEGAVQCEACYTPLPTIVRCPSCGASVQSDASFCGQCGASLKTIAHPAAPSSPAISELPSALPSEPLSERSSDSPFESTSASMNELQSNLPEPIVPDPLVMPDPIVLPNEPAAAVPAEEPPKIPVTLAHPVMPPQPAIGNSATQLQQFSARLLHLQTTNVIELLPGVPVLHIGKPNDRIPPDIDVSGFPNSEIVSRIHADIRVEGDAYYIEDVGSSNGTYINNSPLPMGNRHRLRSGDRISLGKGDKVTFLFQMG